MPTTAGYWAQTLVTSMALRRTEAHEMTRGHQDAHAHMMAWVMRAQTARDVQRGKDIVAQYRVGTDSGSYGGY